MLMQSERAIRKNTPLLDIRDLSVGYLTGSGVVRAVEHVSLQLYPGESMGLVGESGSGKSTMAAALLRLLPKGLSRVSGEILFKGKDLLKMSERELTELRWKELSVVFQKSMNAMSPVHRIGEQIDDVYRIHEPGATREAVRERVTELLSVVNLGPRVLDLYPHELSGGMLQRVSIALSLLHRPDLVVFDEATTALDVITQGQILKEIVRLESELDLTSIIITHDISVVAQTCKRVAVMYAGRLMEVGAVDVVLKDPSHPYMRGLIESFPSLTGERKVIKGIPGSLPDLSSPPKGCVFAPRCREAIDICHQEVPKSVDLGDRHVAACHLIGGGAR